MSTENPTSPVHNLQQQLFQLPVNPKDRATRDRDRDHVPIENQYRHVHNPNHNANGHNHPNHDHAPSPDFPSVPTLPSFSDASTHVPSVTMNDIERDADNVSGESRNTAAVNDNISKGVDPYPPQRLETGNRPLPLSSQTPPPASLAGAPPGQIDAAGVGVRVGRPSDVNAKRSASSADRPMRIFVVGGGPSGLIFSCSVKDMLGSKVSVTVLDHRMMHDESLPVIEGPGGHRQQVRWKSSKERVNRREQVVTLQSAVFSSLPKTVRDAMFANDSYSCVWPYSGESPQELGFPRNIQILSIENHLLTLAQKLGVELRPQRGVPQEVEKQIEDGKVDLLVVADGPASQIRKHFIHRFGQDDPRPFSLPDRQEPHVEDTVLALRVKCLMRDPDSVVMTISQNRFLLNAKDGEGYLYMRLTKHEASEVRGRTANGKHFTGCIQSQPCNLVIQGGAGVGGGGARNGRGGYGDQYDTATIDLMSKTVVQQQQQLNFACPTHGTIFIPPGDPHSLLWPRVQEGLRLFDCKLKAITVFRLSMTLRPRYVAELTDTGTIPPVFGALIGDAANAIHFWPGRGLNHGIYSAVSLARTVNTAVSQFGRRRFMRSADFTQYEAAMSALQHRHKDRAWRAMVQPHFDTKKTQAVSDIIAEAIEGADKADRQKLLADIERTVYTFCNSLSTRLPMRPMAQDIMKRVYASNTETLSVFARCGTWETFLSGGPEVNLEMFLPRPDKDVEVRVKNRARIRNRAGENGETKEHADAETDTDTDGPSSMSSSRASPRRVRQPNDSNGSLEARIGLAGYDILSSKSVKTSFILACELAGSETKTLGWAEAVRELQALFIRANVANDLTTDDIFDAVEDADCDDSDRIDSKEFEAAVKLIVEKKVQKGSRLGDIWTKQFENAAEKSGKVSYRAAARIVSRLASEMGAARKDMVDRTILREEFKKHGDSDGMVDLQSFLNVSALVMLGE